MNSENHYRKVKPFVGNAGFTLLEIIAVLVIMSILAVVAVPKYFDLQAQAKEKAMGTGIAEAVGRVNGYFAEQVLDNNSPSQIEYSTATLGADLGDFTLSVSGGGAGETTDITLLITGNADTPLEALTMSRVVPRPGL